MNLHTVAIESLSRMFLIGQEPLKRICFASLKLNLVLYLARIENAKAYRSYRLIRLF